MVTVTTNFAATTGLLGKKTAPEKSEWQGEVVDEEEASEEVEEEWRKLSG